MKLSKPIIVILAIFALTACGKFGLYSGDSSAVMATVGDVELRSSTLEGIYRANMTKEDSAAVREQFIASWVLSEVKRQAAEQQIEGNDRNLVQIEQMVAEYRAKLLTHKFEQDYLATHIDTTITAQQIEAYYKANPDNFKLAGPLVKAIVVRIPSGLRQSKRLEDMFRKGKDAALDDFINICHKNNYRVDDFRDQWVDFSTVLQHIPFGKVNFDEFLKSKDSYEVTDDQFKYMMRIESHLLSGELSPIERETATISRILHNLRRSELLKALNDSLMQTAKSKKLIHIE